ncbi:MAG: hypothetical protein KAQ83_00015 [Nanoarchaeota archaeon]|nr:hypothetical protein [Nanoarchaeota archaeon]
MKKLLLLILLILIIPLVSAKSGHLTLLAVQNVENNIGSTADLYLEIESGSGRVFLDTFPLTQIDTQMSTRLAKEIACEFLEKNCNNYDFFYTIRAGSSIIGGPSAGAALAALTVILLDDLEYDESIVVTGSINSGGIIGPVGGIPTKIDVAEKNNISKILIPSTKLNATNSSLNRTIQVVEVATLKQIIKEFTGKDYGQENYELQVNQEYDQIMKKISTVMCNRTARLKEQVETYYPDSRKLAIVQNKTIAAKNALNQSRYYPAASYCFGANIDLGSELTKNLSNEKTLEDISDVKSAIEKFEDMVDKKEIQTISDLQAKIIVKERLMDAKDSLTEGSKNINSSKAQYQLAYARERFHSAIIWAYFFNMSGKKIDLKPENVRASCINKIAEAEERFNYIITITPLEFNSTKQEISQARKYLLEDEYEMCIFKANKAKADIDVTLSVMGISKDEEMQELIESKLKYAEEQIAREISKDSFPIMGYSYYLYSLDLKESDPISSLIYAELSLELSNMWPYFNLEPKSRINLIDFNKDFLKGFVAGLIFIILILLISNKKRKNP